MLMFRNDNDCRPRTAPNGTIIEFAPLRATFAKPPLRLSLVVTKASSSKFHEGRAGMLYRDLVPDRLGGRFIASHIQIPKGGPVPDYTHFHDVEFQFIVVASGWVRVVYEDQGPSFVMHKGDCVPRTRIFGCIAGHRAGNARTSRDIRRSRARTAQHRNAESATRLWSCTDVCAAHRENGTEDWTGCI